MKKTLLILTFLLLFSVKAYLQTIYTIGTANWTNTFTSSGGAFDFTSGVALFSSSNTGGNGATFGRFLTTDGTTGGTISTLKPGQKLSITVTGQDGGGRTGITTGGRIGFALGKMLHFILMVVQPTFLIDIHQVHLLKLNLLGVTLMRIL